MHEEVERNLDLGQKRADEIELMCEEGRSS